MADEFDKLKREIEKGSRVVSLSGLTSVAAKAFVLSKLQAETGKTFAIVTESNGELESWEADLQFFCDADARANGPSTLISLPSFEADPYSGVSPHAETQERRALALWQLRRGDHSFVILSARSLIQRTVTPDEIASLGCLLVRDAEFPPETLIERLFAGGYVREEPLFGPGQFSVRGGIIDVWSPDADAPVRIEFFGDTIDSIRSFDPDTQLSTGHLDEIAVAPMREIALSAQDLKDWAFFARERFGDEKFYRNLKDRTDFADEGETFSGWEFLLPLVRPLGATVFDHLSDCVFVIDEPTAVEHALAETYEHVGEHYNGLSDAGDFGLEPNELFASPEELRASLGGSARLELRSLGRTAAVTDEEFAVGESSDASPLFLFPTAENAVELEIQSRSTRKFHGDIPEFVSDLVTHTKAIGSNGKSEIVAQTAGMAERIVEILREYDSPLLSDAVRVGDLSSGFELPPFGLKIYTEGDIFGDAAPGELPTAGRRSKLKTGKSKLGAFISDFRDLKTGDYVVHVDHGIGRFDGLQTISSQGAEREFMLLIYNENAKLFVPVERMDLVSRYSSGEATQPTLDRLGGIGWQKTKAKAKRSDARHGRRAAQALRRTKARQRTRLSARRTVAARI